MNITLSSISPPEVDVVLLSRSPEVEVIVSPSSITLDLIGLPGPRGIQGLQGPPGLPGTIVHVGPTAPQNPLVNDLWVDTS